MKHSRNAPHNRKDKIIAGEQKVVKPKFQEQRLAKIIPLSAKNDRQKAALEAFTTKQLVILSGAAGVGKTELMCWWACKLWLEGKIDNIVICRPYKHLGHFDLIEDAFNAYKLAKEVIIKDEVNRHQGLIDERVYDKLNMWSVDIED